MPIGLLVTFALWGVCICLTLWPVRRPRPLALLSFLISVVVNELPQIPALLILLSVVPYLAQGGVSGGDAATVAGLTVPLFAGLAAITVRATRARPTMERALGAELPSPPAWHGLATLLRPFPTRPRSVVRVSDLAYGSHHRQRLDVYHQRARPDGAPVLVYFHGGGYFSGGKRREGQALVHRLAARGWVCISATYRLRPEAGFEDHLHDAKRVIAWAHEESARFGGDPSCVVSSGSSAGAHLTAIAALSQNDPQLQQGFEAADTSLAAAVCFCGYYGRYYGRDETESPISTPLGYDAATAPPFLVVHGDLDTDAPVDAARDLVGHLRGASSEPVVYAELPGAQHNFDRFRSLRYEAVIDGVEAFLARTVAGSAR